MRKKLCHEKTPNGIESDNEEADDVRRSCCVFNTGDVSVVMLLNNKKRRESEALEAVRAFNRRVG